MSKLITQFALVLGIGLLATEASASGLRIAPVRVDLSAAQPSSQVDLFNSGSVPVPVQVTAYRWSQEQGEDKYERTKDIFFAPPIVTVPPNGRASVRLRLRNRADTPGEASYRLYFQELPPTDEVAAAGTTFRVRFGVPLFVLPKGEVAPELKVQVTPRAGVLDVSLENSGLVHLKIEGMEAFSSDVDRANPGTSAIASTQQSKLGTGYLLPGSRHLWQLSLPPGTDPQKVVVLVRTDDRSNRAGSGIDLRGWHWHPLSAGR